MLSLQEQYLKEIKRIKNAIRREAKKGNVLTTDIIPPKPKKITEQTIRRLNKITPDKIRSKAVEVDLTTGEILGRAGKKHQVKKPTRPTVKNVGKEPKEVKPRKTGQKKVKTPKKQTTEGLAEEPTVNVPVLRKKKQTKRKGLKASKEVSISIQYNNFMNYIRERLYTDGGKLLYQFIENYIKSLGEERVVEIINKALADGFELKEYHFYEIPYTLQAINDLLFFFPSAINEFGDITEVIDFMEDWEDFD